MLSLVGYGTKTAGNRSPAADTINNNFVVDTEKTQETYDEIATMEESESPQIRETESEFVNTLAGSFKEKDYEVSIEHAEPEILRGERCILSLSGLSEDRITVYLYDDITLAQDDVLCIDKSGTTITLPEQTIYVTWKSVPHYYYQDKAIIEYVGMDNTILMLLTELYGEQFAGGTY